MSPKNEPYVLDGRGLNEAVAEAVRTEKGDDATVAGWVAVMLYDQPDGASGLHIVSTSYSPDHCSKMLELAAHTVRGQVDEPDEEPESYVESMSYTSSESTIEPAPSLG